MGFGCGKPLILAPCETVIMRSFKLCMTMSAKCHLARNWEVKSASCIFLVILSSSTVYGCYLHEQEHKQNAFGALYFGNIDTFPDWAKT